MFDLRRAIGINTLHSDTPMNARATIHKCSAAFRAMRCVALFGLLFPKLCLGAESPIILEPGTTNAPGPALEDSLVAFRWRAAQGATGYKLIIGDLETRELEDYTFPATILFSQVSLIAGRRYFWHVSTLVGTNP